MSRIGNGDNINKPDKKCFGCKYWQNAGIKSRFGGYEYGRCTVGYCKKYEIDKKRGKK